MPLPRLAPLRSPGRYFADERHQRQAVRGSLGRADGEGRCPLPDLRELSGPGMSPPQLPFPHRGYWAKRQFGKAPARPPLPAPRPGEVNEWERGDAVPRPTPAVALPADSGTSGRPASRSARPARHHLLTGVRESFEKARFSEVGYLRPFKRNLVDIFVTKEALAYALDTDCVAVAAVRGLDSECETRAGTPVARRRRFPPTLRGVAVAGGTRARRAPRGLRSGTCRAPRAPRRCSTIPWKVGSPFVAARSSL